MRRFNRQIIIGLTGKKGSGKNFVANIIKEVLANLYNVKDVREIAFADKIKDVVCQLVNIDREKLDVMKRSEVTATFADKSTTFSGRELLRGIGMLMRDYDDEQFNRYVKEKIENNKDTVWIVTDCRFDNEIEMIRSMHGVIVNIDNPYCIVGDHHVSESLNGHNVADYNITNIIGETSKAELIDRIENLIEREFVD